MKSTLTVAAAQLRPAFLNKEKSVEKVCLAIEEAAEKGAKLLVFPEAYISGYPDWVWVVPNSNARVLNALYTELVLNAVSLPDPLIEKVCQKAKKHRINVALGVHERNSESSGASLFNTLLFINEKGTLMGKHRKLIPTGGERLVWAQGKGDSLRAYETSAGRLAGLLCWENLMPLARNAIYQTGAQILAAPTWDKSEKWQISMQHIAREGGLFVISCCMAVHKDDIPDLYDFKQAYPKDRTWINAGNSMIIDPNGTIISGPLEAQEGLLYAEIDLSQIISAKRMFDVVGHYARPDVFQFDLNHSTDHEKNH